MVVLVCLGALAWTGVERTRARVESLRRGEQTLTRLVGLLSTLTDAETAVRGYVIVGDRAFLEQYFGSREKVTADVAALAELMSDQAEQTARLESLRPVIEARYENWVQLIGLREQEGAGEGALALVATGEGRRLHDRIRAILAEMRRAEERVSAERGEAVRESVWQAQMWVVLGSAVAVAVAISGWLSSRREVEARRRAEAELGTTLKDLETRVAERTAALAQSEELVRSTLESVGDGFLACDGEWRVIYANSVATDLLGMSWEAMDGVVFWELFPAAAGSRLEAAYRAAAGGEVQDFENLYEPWQRWFRNRVRPRRGGGVTVWFQEITERRRLEEETRRWWSLFRSAQFGLAYASIRDNTFLGMNQAFARERGYEVEELLGRPLSVVYAPEARGRWRENLETIDRSGHLVFEAIHQRKNGTRFPVLMEVTVVHDAAGNPVSRVACAMDITEWKRAESALRERNEELMRFMYTVSHDLKSPLVTIRTFLGYLEQDLRGGDASRVEKDMGYMRGAAEKMSELLEDILELSRVGRKSQPPEDVSLQAVVGEALELVAGSVTERGVRVEVTTEPVWLTGDRVRLREVFQNLIDNAVKFMGDQAAPRVEIGVEREGEAEGANLVLFVRDNGVGIDPRHREKLFGLFEKLHPGSPGTGIGLALVKRIVEVHGGRIWAESDGPGLGSVFRFTLERARLRSAVNP